MKNPVKVAHQHIKAYQAERRRVAALDRELEAALIDPTFLERATKPPTPIAVRFLDGPVKVDVRHLLKTVRVKSIDGILAV